MTISKTMETLLIRAEKYGEAVRKVREKNVLHKNSNSDAIINQWKIIIQNEIITIEHYDTKIAQIDRKKQQLLYYYGQSYSDAMILNGLCTKYGIKERFSYSKKEKTFNKK